MAKVRCKMKCSKTEENADGTHCVEMFPVTSGSTENETFFKWTPGGQLTLRVLNEQHFKPGKEYYIDIEEA